MNSNDLSDIYEYHTQLDMEQYTQYLEYFEQYEAMEEDEAESSVKHTRRYIARDRELAKDKLRLDYFRDEYFCRRKHGLPGMIGSIDCMHWEWVKCPKSLHGQFKRRDKKYSTIMLEAVTDQNLWFWHAYFGVPGANNDLNVLYGSSLFGDLLADKALEAPFQVNRITYEKDYYLADGIYPQWATFVKAFTIARDLKTQKFKIVQESARKDIERALESYKIKSSILVNIGRCTSLRVDITTLKNDVDVDDFVNLSYQNKWVVDLYVEHNGYDTLDIRDQSKTLVHNKGNESSDAYCSSDDEDLGFVDFHTQADDNVVIKTLITNDPFLNKLCSNNRHFRGFIDEPVNDNVERVVEDTEYIDPDFNVKQGMII
ncbi:zinc finger, CCHC-type containing protein [Tanacetum coccineum]|uniref:Zinc finger, CCHC-type containing protein n=1 Tax=Tanacetum coccineum TaxID=301880 RepID=A0ABQ5CQI1_9ASTR